MRPREIVEVLEKNKLITNLKSTKVKGVLSVSGAIRDSKLTFNYVTRLDCTYIDFYENGLLAECYPEMEHTSAEASPTKIKKWIKLFLSTYVEEVEE